VVVAFQASVCSRQSLSRRPPACSRDRSARSCRAHNGRGSEEGNNSKGTKNPDENDKVEQAHAVLQAAPPELVRGFAIHLVPIDEVPGRTPATALGGFGG
jgi:hypothetical protein